MFLFMCYDFHSALLLRTQETLSCVFNPILGVYICKVTQKKNLDLKTLPRDNSIMNRSMKMTIKALLTLKMGIFPINC